MKTRCRITVWPFWSVCALTGALLFAFPAHPVQADAALSRELKMVLMNRVPSENERQKVLHELEQAVEGGYSEDRLAPVIKKSLDRDISGEALARMIATLDKANRKGLPTQPYGEKIMEGLAKGVNGERILAALDRVNQRMEWAAAQAARIHSAEDPSQLLVIRTGEALAAGMDRKDLERIYDVMAQERVNRNIAPEDIMEMVKAASGYGVGSKDAGNYAISLMKNRKADLGDIRHYLKKLSDRVYRRSSRSGSQNGQNDGDGASGEGESDHDDGDGSEHDGHEGGESDH